MVKTLILWYGLLVFGTMWPMELEKREKCSVQSLQDLCSVCIYKHLEKKYEYLNHANDDTINAVTTALENIPEHLIKNIASKVICSELSASPIWLGNRSQAKNSLYCLEELDNEKINTYYPEIIMCTPNHMVFLPDYIVFSNTSPKNRAISVFDMRLKTVIKKLIGHTNTIHCLVGKNNLIASGSQDKTARIWDVTQDSKKACIAALHHSASIKALCFDPTSTYLITSAGDHLLYLWDVEHKSCMKKCSYNGTGIMSISWNNNAIMTKNEEGKVLQWNNASPGLSKIILGAIKNINRNTILQECTA